MLRARPQELTLTVHHRSDAGRVRDHNEDYLGYRQPEEPALRAEAGWLYVVADGVGGAQAGEVASKLAVQTLLIAYYHSYGESPADRLREAFAAANRAVHEQASGQDNYRMSTTLVAAVIRGHELTVANVGDSRAYLIQDGQIRQISTDHAMVARLVAEGVITPEQAESHPQRHVISRSVGARPDVQVDIFTETFLPGDRLLLCSDGLTEYLTDAEILDVMQGEDPEANVQRLVDQANERGGSDNITVLAVRALRGRQDRLPPLVQPQKTKAATVSRRLSPLRIGVIAIGLLICAAGLTAGAYILLNPTPTPTPTATATSPPPIVATTTGVTITPTATTLPTETPSATPSPAGTNSPTVTESLTLTPTPTDVTELSPLSTPTPSSTTEGSPLPTPPP
jgi:serine/threonine protein phosphatase PrpC